MTFHELRDRKATPMQFPFEGDDVSDVTPRRFTRVLAIGLACFLVLGLIGVWKLLPHGAASTGTSAQTRNDNSLNATLVWIPAGTFTMGSVKDEENGANVGSQVTVTLTKGFWLGQTEVTQAQWQHVMQTTPWNGQADVMEGDDYPATYVSWRDALEFCKKLTEEERTAARLPAEWQYTLPTEAQWEFACRAGTTTRFSFGDNNADLAEYGWFGDNANALGNRYPHRVAQRKANPWGLYDMHGNVSEWCQDVFSAGALPGGSNPVVSVRGSKRVLRGGNWGDSATYCESAFRTRREPGYRGHALGFRLAAVPEIDGAGSWNDIAADNQPRVIASQPQAPRSRFETKTCDVIVANRPPARRTFRGGVVSAQNAHDVMQQSIVEAAADNQPPITAAISGEKDFKKACEDGWEPYAVQSVHDSSGRTIERHFLRRQLSSQPKENP